MKKFMRILVCQSGSLVRGLAMFCVLVCWQGATAQKASVTGVYPYGNTANAAPMDSHWTLYLDAGGNWFDADYAKKDSMNAIYAPTIGLGFNYNFNSTWGLGLEGLYSTLRIKEDIKDKEENSNDELFKVNMFRIQALSSFDIFNAWRPNNQSKIFALNVLLGGGIGIYKYKQNPNYNGTQLLEKNEKDNKFQMCPLVTLGADFQFNVSRSISLGLKATYSYFAKDDIDYARIKGTNNDGIVDLALSLRYKIGATKKSHVCNVADDEKFETRMNKAKQDAMPAKVDTVVLVQKDTVVVTNTITEVQEVAADNNYYYIYFAPNQSALKAEDLTVIQQVASRLQRDNNLYVEIVGYCDNTGSEKYNMQLGATRAHNVMNEFVEEYAIAPERIAAYSGGIIQGKRSKAAYGPNRRVEIRLLNADEFSAAKQRYRQAPQPAPASERHVSEVSETTNSVSASSVAVDMQLSGKTVAKEVTRQDWTLAKMARKHYGNAYCWVYIYQANKDKVVNPDKINVGLEINIPELTESQQMITRQQADKILANLK